MRQEAEINRTIPTGWIREKLGSLADKITKGATPTTYGYEFQRSGINFIKIQNVFAGTIDLASITDFISEEAHQNQKKSILKVDDVLFSIAGTIGETSILKPQHLPANTNQAFAIISGFSELLLPKYLEFQLRSFVSQKTKEKARGGAMNNVSLDDLKHLELLLPPLNEQHRIVAKIEELFSELDKGIENLKTARAQLKVYRQALLKHAFEGKLTAQWRAENQDKLETADALLKRIQQERAQRYQQQLADWEAAGKQGSKPKAPKLLPPFTADELVELPELPEGWGWEKLGNIAELIGGVTKGKNLEGKEKLSLPYLRVANVQDGYLDLKEIKYIEVETQDKDKFRLEFGDVLYTEGGDKDKLGRGAVWRSQIESCIHQNHIFRARVFGGVVSPEILSLYSQTRSAKKYFFRHAKQTTNLASINLTVLANLPTAIVSQLEQKQILLEIEARLSEADQLDQTLTTALQQAEALRQSILKKAFAGLLVPQDPHDEPASALLARIQAERADVVVKPRKTAKDKT